MRVVKRVFFSAVAFFGITVLLWALPFLTLQSGFTQELWGTDPGFMGGVAFAPDGDVWVTPCVFGGGSLRRFDAQSTVLVNGTQVHPLIATVASNTGCGLTNHPDGSLYSNTSGGVTRQDASTGVASGGPFGPGGNALGIAVHPLTLELVYVGSDGTLFAVDPGFTASRTFSIVNQGFFIDGIFFDPTGRFLFTATRTGGFRVTIIDASNGNLIQHVALSSEPDGIAFHASSPKFVVTNNTDGTMSRLDFPGEDFTQPPTVSLFASGGFRGDLSQVGADGCLYLTQNGTRFDDGTTSSSNSIVRVCGGFSPAPGVSSISLDPLSAVNDVGTSHTVTAHVEIDSVPQPNVLVTFSVLSGPHAGQGGTDSTDANGDATFAYTGTSVGLDTLQASFVDGNGDTRVSNPVTKEWVPSACLTLNFDTDDEGQALVHGQHLGNGDVEFNGGSLFPVVLTSSVNTSGAGTAAILNSTTGPALQDPDLLVGTGNILILQTDADTSQCPAGSDIYCTHNDDADGGTLSFSFTRPLTASSIRLVDADTDNGSTFVVLIDATGRQRTYTVPINWTGDRTLGQPGMGDLDLTTLSAQPGYASSATATESAGFDPSLVVRLDVHLAGSGGIDDLTICPTSSFQRAGVATRNGSNVNPQSLKNWTQPLVGGTWVTGLDCSSHAAGTAFLLVFSSAQAPQVTGYGELLVGGRRLYRSGKSHLSSVAYFAAPIPQDVALIGLQGHAQGLCNGSPGAQLSNALDIVMGF